VIVDPAEVPVYLRIAEKATQLQELGMSDKAIARVLGVSDKTVAKAIDQASASIPEYKDSRASGGLGRTQLDRE